MLVQLDDDLHVSSEEVPAVHATQDDDGEYVSVKCKHQNYKVTSKRSTARELAAEIAELVNRHNFE